MTPHNVHFPLIHKVACTGLAPSDLADTLSTRGEPAHLSPFSSASFYVHWGFFDHGIGTEMVSV